MVLQFHEKIQLEVTHETNTEITHVTVDVDIMQ